MNEEIKIVLMRFFRGVVAGAVASMTTFLATGSISNWTEFSGWIRALSFAGVIGAITGGLLALDKYIRLEPVGSKK